MAKDINLRVIRIDMVLEVMQLDKISYRES